MQNIVTAKIRIQATSQVVATVRTFQKSLQFCVDTAWKHKIKNNIKLHPLVYKFLRKTLPSQLAIACIKQACGIVKKARTKPKINHASVRYNFPRSANLKGNVLVLRLLHERQTFKFTIPRCYKAYFNWNICESLLRLDKKGRAFFLFIFSKETDIMNSALKKQTLGIDLGINNLAVTSGGHFHNAARIKQIKRKYRYMRSKLQAKGTRSSRRLLKCLSGRETRWMRWENHKVSKQIVNDFSGNKIVMENLKGIRKQNRGKQMNYWISNWSFYQLQQFIQYKAEQKGIQVIKVDPHYTSQLCHKCGHLGVRSKGSFACSPCGLSSYSADLNAGRNLAHPRLDDRQGSVNTPHISSHDTKANVELRLSLGINNCKGVMPHSLL